MNRFKEPRKDPVVGKEQPGPLEIFFRKYFSAEDAKFLKRFYNLFFTKKNSGRSWSNSDKMNHLEHIVNLFGKEKVIGCLKSIWYDWNVRHIPVVHNPKYIEKVISNFDVNKTIKEEAPSIIPKKYKENPRGYDKEEYNWDYKCKCGEIIGPWTVTCPKCNANIVWED